MVMLFGVNGMMTKSLIILGSIIVLAWLITNRGVGAIPPLRYEDRWPDVLPSDLYQ